MTEQIKKILDEWDPIELIYLSADEYQPIAEELADTINKSFSSRSVYIALNRAFSVYGVNFSKPKAECYEIAEKILKSIQDC